MIMKHYYQLMLILLVSLGLMIFTMQNVSADYTIEGYQVQINLDQAGNAQVTRKITYVFGDEYHGVLYQQAVRNDQQTLTDPQVTLKQKGKTIPVDQNPSGRNNTYQLSREKNLYKFKVFHPGDSDQLQVIYRYRLNQVVKSYQDIAELNWKIIGDNWDRSLYHVKITINLPAQKVKSLRAWAHGDLNGQIKVNRQAGRVTLIQTHNPENTFIEAHVIFDPALVPLNQYQGQGKAKAKIMRQEAQLAKQANQERKRNRQIRFAFGIGAAVIAVLDFIWLDAKIYRLPKNTRRPVSLEKAPHNFEQPPYGVGVASVLCFDKLPASRVFTGHLLELVTKRVIEIERLKRNDFQINLLKSDQLDEHQEAFLMKLFEMGDGKSFKLSQIDDLPNTNKESLNQLLKAWQDTQFNQAQTLNYRFATKLTWLKFGCHSLVIVGLLGLSAYLGFFPWFVSGLVTLFLIGVAIYHYRFNSPYTTTGIQMMNDVRGYYTVLRDLGKFEKRELEEHLLWDDLMAYATAFGLAKRVVKRLKELYDLDFLEVTMGPAYYFLILHNSENFTHAFDSSLRGLDVQNTSSSSGNGGGFSAGSSGGFGGGSGGGAF